MHAVDRDLTPFKKSGGKLISYAGWMDPVVPPQDTAAYYEGVAKVMGGYDKTRDFFRLFTAPGMGHCAGGPGPNSFDALTALEQWVEKGVAPDKLIATHSTGGKVDRSRPLCPYPQVARYTGKGSIDEAANFACVDPGGASRRDARALGNRIQQRPRMGDLVVIHEMAHAGIDLRRHLRAHSLTHLRALAHARFRNMRIDIAAAEEHRRAVESP